MAKLVCMNRTLDRDNEVRHLRDCPDVLIWANCRRGESAKPQLIVRRAQALPVPSFRVTHCFESVRRVILCYPIIYLDFTLILMFYNVIVDITRKGILLYLFPRYLSVCPLYRVSTL